MSHSWTLQSQIAKQVGLGLTTACAASRCPAVLASSQAPCSCWPRDPTSSPAEFQGSCSLVVLALGSGVFGGVTVQALWAK